MFNTLQEWLTNKLGISNCWNLNFNNIGERFKDGVLFARLLHKYQVIPDCYIQDFKTTNYYTACLRNIKNINLWLKFINILIEDDVIHEIANGQSLAVTKLLYELYLKFEMLKQSHPYDINIGKIEPISNSITIFCKSNNSSLKSNQDRKKQKARTFNTNKEILNGLLLIPCLEGIEYTAIDVLKSKKYINARKKNILNFIQNNMNNFYNLFMKNLNSELFKNDYDKKHNEICRSSIFDTLNKKEDSTITDHWSYISQEETKHENSILNSTEMEYLTQSLDAYSYKDLVKQDAINDYIQHTGLWSAEYLNIDPYECKHNFLSMIVKEVLNFEYDKSKVQFLDIKKLNVAGVIDVIQNTKVIQLIKNNLNTKEILSFTAEDALNACLNDYKEEMKISMYKKDLYQVLEEHDHLVNPKQYSYNKEWEKQNIKKSITNNTSKLIKNLSNINVESMHVTDKQFNVNKLIQTPEQIPEPDYNNPVLSSMAKLGKLIDEKQMKNHDLQIGDIINCIGEYIKKNQRKNGWLLLDFPVQPLQMALLEYKLTKKIPTFGREIYKHNKKKSKIIPENQDSENALASKNTYLSHCIKIINHQDEIKNEKWSDFLQFYKQNCIQVLINQFNNITKQPKKYANALIGLIINEENELEIKNIFKVIKIFDDDDDDNDNDRGDEDSIESKNNGQLQISELSFMNYEESYSINSKQITNQFQLLSTESKLNNYTYTALNLCDMWETMEHVYIHQIKELLNLKKIFFEEIKTNMSVVANRVNQTMFLHNTTIANLINKYENESFVNGNTINIMHTISELLTNLWDKIDSDFEQIIQSIKEIIDSQNTVAKNNTLITIHEQLIQIELKRTTTTLHFLNKYYDDINEHNINEFDYISGINKSKDNIDRFQLFCTDIIYQIEKYMGKTYKVIDNNKPWIQSIETEINRFVSQVYRIKISMLKDTKHFKDITKIDHHLEKIHNIYQYKINDINKLFEVSKCSINSGKSIKWHIKQISRNFYTNETSIFEIIHNQMFNSKNKFNMNQLKSIVNKLLDNSPTFKMEINELIDILNELGKEQHVYPINWPTDIKFCYHFAKEILGSNVITIDWRDFVVQCMELPYPNTDELLYYRKLFQTYDIGDETITVENYITIKLWFENESHQYDEVKWLLCDMYQVKNRFNYSAMLLAFCKDEQPWIGLRKSFCLIFGWDPLDVKKQQINQLNSRCYEESKTDEENMKSNISDNISLFELTKESFTFDKNTMEWFLTIILKFYTNSKKQLGIINISQLVKSVFEHIQTREVKPTLSNLFQNNLMDELYSTVYKFKTIELSEVTRKIVMTNKIL